MSTVFEDHPEMSDDLASFAFVPKKAQEFLKPLLAQGAQGHVLNVLGQSWKKAVQVGAVVSKPDSVTFQVLNGSDPSVTLCAVVKPNVREGGSPWYLTYAGKDAHGILKDVAIAEQLPQEQPVAETAPQAGIDAQESEQASAPQTSAPPSNVADLKDYAFIWMGPGSTFFKEIAARALPEPWGFGENDYSILQSYITQTFYKLRRDGLVLENPERTFAALNTGLVTPRLEDIFLCFKPNHRSDARQPWEFAGICTQFDNTSDFTKRLSARLRSTFPDMPQRARFFTNVSDIVFDASKEIICNWDHIIIENVDRIPTDFLASQLYGRQAAEMRQLVESIDYDPDRGDEDDPYGNHAKGEAAEQFNQLRAFLNDNPSIFNRIKATMDGALEVAQKRAAYSFRTGVPSFYPRADKIQILLPLCLMDEDEPDCALVTSKDAWGNYEGMTILTLRMAYKNARLLCRPESEWLSV